MKHTHNNHIEVSYPLSPMQQGMLFHSLYAPEAGIYLQQIVCTLHEALDVAAFTVAWQRVTERHAVLRTAFRWESPNAPHQDVYRQVHLRIAQLDWRHLAAAAQVDELNAYLAADRKQGFKLTVAPLMRLMLARLAEAEYRFIWTFHHALLDGRSFLIVLKDVFTLYEAIRCGQECTLEAVAPYQRFIEYIEGQDWIDAAPFWRDMLRGFSTPTAIGLQRSSPLPAVEEGSGAQRMKLAPDVTARLAALAHRHKLTLNTLVQGAWALLLSRYSGEEDIVFGATRAGRRTAGMDEGSATMVGLLINTVPIRAKVTPDMQLVPWLTALRAQWMALRDYEHTPLVAIQEWSDLPHGTALFETLLVFENQSLNTALRAQGGPWARRTFSVLRQVNYPLTLAAYGGAALELSLEYDRQRFDDASIARMLGHLRTLLEGIADNPNRRLGDLPLLTAAEEQQILITWNATQAVYPSEQCIHQLFEEQAARTPNAVAVIGAWDLGTYTTTSSSGLSYAALNRRANQLAHFLRKRGVGPETLVGICLPRTPDMLIAILGVLKAGGAFLPLDPAYPHERLAFMLEDAQPQVLLTQQALEDVHLVPSDEAGPARTATIQQLHPNIVNLDADWPLIAQEPDRNLASDTRPDNLAYVIYTSGSTGRPKGTLLQHRGLCNLSAAQTRAFGLGVGDRVLQFASMSFDAAVWEVIMALCSGATLVLAHPADLASPPDLLRILRAAHITAATLPPSLLAALPHADLPELHTLIAAGERCTAELVARWAPGRRFFNAYGPTEATVCASLHQCDPNDPRDPPIGRPLPNVQLYILDAYRRPVPIGVPGELHIGGVGLARGYLKRPELTNERFVQLPIADFTLHKDAPPKQSTIYNLQSTIYKTGDLARYRPDGSIEFLGRIDQQVKIRGFRIEPGEIEAALEQHPAVRAAVVVAHEAGQNDTRLLAYVVPQSDAAPLSSVVSDVRSFLKARLPDHMLPAAFLELAALPRTPNGKVDRRALPSPALAQPERGTQYVAPRNPTEQRIAAIWAEVLHVAQVGAEDDFFALGGHSLLATELISRLRAELQLELPLRILFERTTVARLAEYIEAIRWAGQTEAAQANEQYEQGEF